MKKTRQVHFWAKGNFPWGALTTSFYFKAGYEKVETDIAISRNARSTWRQLTVFDDVGDVEDGRRKDPVVDLELFAESWHLENAPRRFLTRFHPVHFPTPH